MLDLTIERLAHGGDAISHAPDGRTVFVSGACPGDRVLAEVTEDKPRFIRAETKEVLEASANRVKPPCPYFGVCGGCSWQHISYSRQLTAKRDALVDALERIGHIADAESIVAPTVPSPREYGYRNKVEFVTDSSSGRLALGFHRAGSSEVVPVERCLLLPPALERTPKALGGALGFIAGRSEFEIERVGVRAARHTKDVEIALWTTPSAFPRAIAAKTLGQAVKNSSVVRVLVKTSEHARSVSRVEVLSGNGFWKERLGGHSYAISAPSFFQVNTEAAEKLVACAIDALACDGTDRVLDLFAGAGTFTLPIAELAGEVVAIESAGSAVRDLRRNLESAQLWADVIGGDATREIEQIGHCDLVLVDPPRTGLTPGIVKALEGMHPRGIVYVSCDPATLARDAASLQEAGFRLTAATPIDLFPQTYHVETVARFDRQD